MSSALPIRFSATKIRLIRAAKRLLWPHPRLYFPFGMMRKRGNVLDTTKWELYLDGFPRSANTFARVAFLSANPNAKVRTHIHSPTFVIQLAKAGIPGMVLIRNPLDAAVSWAIYKNWPMERAVAYWNDYYKTLLPMRSELFFVRFDEATADFGAVMRAFNERWGTTYVPFEHTPESAARCFQLTEDLCLNWNGALLETTACRPSKFRLAIKEKHMANLEQSSFLRDELARANELYHQFVYQRPMDKMSSTTRLIPEKAQAATLQAEARV